VRFARSGRSRCCGRPARKRWLVLVGLLTAAIVSPPARGHAAAVPSATAPAPGFADRGVIEGFYGPPWAKADRLHLLRWMSAHGMNLYIHAPKGDPYQRLQWREPYPGAELQQYGTEIAVGSAAGLRWVPSVSPGFPLQETTQGTSHDVDICFSCQADRAVLYAKFDRFWDLGARSFMVSFDDTVKASTHPEDAAAYGPGDYGYGLANADLLNAVLARYTARDPTFHLYTVPVDYSGVTPTAYLRGFSGALAAPITVMWTGVNTVNGTIDCSTASQYAQAIGRTPLLWDNFPVNDYATDKLMLGPYAGRAPDLPKCLTGIVANPALQVRANEISLFTVADYLRDPVSYQPERSYNASLTEFGGAQRALLERFVGNVRSTALDRKEAVRFSTLRDAFLRSLGAGDWPIAADALAAELDADVNTPDLFLTTFHDQQFVREISTPPGSSTVPAPTSGPAVGSWLARLRFNAVNGKTALGAATGTRPQITASLEGGQLRGRVVAPMSAADAQSSLAAVEALRTRDDGNPTNVFGDRTFYALGLTGYLNENQMDAFFTTAGNLVAQYLPVAAAASRSVSLTVDGHAVPLAADGTFSLTTRTGHVVDAVAVDGIGASTHRRFLPSAGAAPVTAPTPGHAGRPGRRSSARAGGRPTTAPTGMANPRPGAHRTGDRLAYTGRGSAASVLAVLLLAASLGVARRHRRRSLRPALSAGT